MVSLEGCPVFPIPAIVLPSMEGLWGAGVTLRPPHYSVPPPPGFSDLSTALNMYLHLKVRPYGFLSSVC